MFYHLEYRATNKSNINDIMHFFNKFYWLLIWLYWSNIESEHFLEDAQQLYVCLASLKGDYLHSEGVIIVDWVDIVVHQKHLLLNLTRFFQVFQVLHQLPIDFPAGFPVKSFLDDPVDVDDVEHCVCVALLPRCVYPNSEYFAHCAKELSCEGPRFDKHVFSLKLPQKKSTWVLMQFPCEGLFSLRV